MNILITTGVGKHEVGGPGQYSHHLSEEFVTLGHQVKVSGYLFEKKLPIGIRHLYFFIKILPSMIWADRVIALDTFSVGVPSVYAARMLGINSTVRIGGDFLWESYVNKRHASVPLSNFYNPLPPLSIKERVIVHVTKKLVTHADDLVFNTEWQKHIWQKAYNIPEKKIRIVKNGMPCKLMGIQPVNKRFVWAGRDIQVKNLEMLKTSFASVKEKHPEIELELITDASHERVMETIKDSYAAILPSISDICPNFILEAASFGKPFIMTKETGIQELLSGGGIFVDPTNIHEIKQAIEKLLDPSVYSMYHEELERTYAPRSWRDVAEDFLTL